MSNNSKPNRLIAEKSPYSFQYALDWHHWREEAFENAKTSRFWSASAIRLVIGGIRPPVYNQVHNNFTPLQKTLRTVCQ
ncbi:hypothetical protein UY9_06384 [Bacillus atrophaeus C89]|nr:hypothetical protein UY9_06384 [Bacillus atrophaeus C89]